jgi:hypothetical protein
MPDPLGRPSVSAYRPLRLYRLVLLQAVAVAIGAGMASSAIAEPQTRTIYISSSPLGATSIYLASSPLGATSVYISSTPLGASTRIGFVSGPSNADLAFEFSSSPLGTESIYFASSPLGAKSVYFSSTPLGAKSVFVADSGTVDLRVHIPEAKISLEQLLAILVAWGAI